MASPASSLCSSLGYPRAASLGGRRRVGFSSSRYAIHFPAPPRHVKVFPLLPVSAPAPRGRWVGGTPLRGRLDPCSFRQQSRAPCSVTKPMAPSIRTSAGGNGLHRRPRCSMFPEFVGAGPSSTSPGIKQLLSLSTKLARHRRHGSWRLVLCHEPLKKGFQFGDSIGNVCSILALSACVATS